MCYNFENIVEVWKCGVVKRKGGPRQLEEKSDL
jgi:hypothetical protein